MKSFSEIVGSHRDITEGNALASIFRNQNAEISKVVELVIMDCMGKDVSTDDMARLFCVSQRTFTRRMTSEGRTFREILKDVRRKSAEKLLLTSDASVSEISKILGYSDSSNFTKAFKNWSGVCPKVYKKLYS